MSEIGRSELRAKTVEYEKRTSELTAPLRDVYRQGSTLPNERDGNTKSWVPSSPQKSIGESSERSESSSQNPSGTEPEPRKGS